LLPSSIHLQPTPLNTETTTLSHQGNRPEEDLPEIKPVALCKGPKQGGPLIIIEGEWFPSGHEVYILFGSTSALARFSTSNILHCTLPMSTVVGEVPVTLVEDDLVTLIGRSRCSFLYEDIDNLEL
jgi:IPT/TIG domain